MMGFQLERVFGRILGLDFSQVNPGALTNGEPNGALGWPVMQPLSGACGVSGGNCIPSPTVLRHDDMPLRTASIPSLRPISPAFPASSLRRPIRFPSPARSPFATEPGCRE